MGGAWWMLHWAACERLLSEQEEPPPCPIGVISGTRTITPPAEKPVTKAPPLRNPEVDAHALAIDQ